MRETVEGINPIVLRWARERSGYTIEQAADRAGKTADVLHEWETGASAPTYVQLEKLAYELYKRPVALFFFPAPPDEPEPSHEFRTLPEFELDELRPDTRLKVRKALAFQISLQELTAGVNPGRRLITRELRINPTRSAEIAARRVRDFLDVPIAQQTAWKTTEDGLRAWRTAVERAGVHIFKDSFEQREISGFSLHDDEFPLIYINNSTAKSRQIFTIFHELGHLLVGTSGVTLRDDSYVNELQGEPHRIEVFCNAFAAQLLLPKTEFSKENLSADDVNISRLARRFKVSREVVLRRLLEMNRISAKQYREKVAKWSRDYGGPEGSGGDYYHNQAAYLSESYMRAAFAKYYQGTLTVEQLAGYLNMKAANVGRLEEIVVERFR